MRIPRIYSSLPLSVDSTVALDERSLPYVVQVLRLRLGAELCLFDGQGTEYQAVLEVVERRRAKARILGQIKRNVESMLRITLGQGISRGERMDYALQKAVELGVSRIVPLSTKHSAINFSSERAEKRLRHWQGVVISACEQCGRNYIPPVDSPQSLTDFLGTHHEGLKVLLDPKSNRPLKELPSPLDKRLTLLIGPEGGLNETEIKQAQQADFTGVRLGPRILRTETATVAALASLQLLWGDL
ncbi:MAG: 16S rRNA (uracil(1498)-N(3))-methyltransferase [Candidatus Nitrosoglobus sp.]|jgi:16S rRNA (uracil1498-N3)-methyltransferase